jgi:hypothetical protein
MPVLSTAAIAAIGVGVSALGVGASVYSQVQASSANAKQIEFQKQAEASRQQSANLDAMRRKRETIRQAQVASAQAESTANNQGAGEGSGIAGALSTISGQAGSNNLGISQQQELGNNIFEANRGALGASQEAARANTFAAAGSGLSSLGGLVTKNAETINRVGTYFGS